MSRLTDSGDVDTPIDIGSLPSSHPEAVKIYVAKINEIKAEILHPRSISGPRLLSSLTEIAKLPFCFEPVDAALEEIIAHERSCSSDKRCSYMFQEAVLQRTNLLNRHTLAPESHVDSLIAELKEYGQKDVSGEPPGIARDRAVHMLKEVGNYHPKARKKVKQVLSV